MQDKKTSSFKERWEKAVNTFNSGDIAGALYLFKRLSEEGVEPAYAEVGKIYEFGGEGVEQDYKKALKWFIRALDEVQAVEGCLGIARIYYFGKGVPVNYDKAFEYYSMLEGTNDPTAQFVLGKMHHLGQGTPVDIEKAKHYYGLASDQGSFHARRNLGLLYAQNGHFFKGAWLWLKSAIYSLKIVLKNPNDSRLRPF